MLKYLVTVGDSRPAGAELVSPEKESFPVLISNILGVKSINLAEQGTSIDQALYKLLNASIDNLVDWEHTLILFCCTGISRSMYINNSQTKEIHPQVKKPVSIAYYKYIHSKELDQFNYIRNVLAAQQYCCIKKSHILFVNNWDRLSDHNIIDQNLFYHKTLTEILNVQQALDDDGIDYENLSRHEYIIPNQDHPNALGHGKIAEELSNWIKEKVNVR